MDGIGKFTLFRRCTDTECFGYFEGQPRIYHWKNLAETSFRYISPYCIFKKGV